MPFEQGRYRKINKILIFILFLNWLVSFIKLILGYAVDSASIVADGYHSFSDGASNIIGLLGVWFAARPKDASHPYGHKKYETFSSLGIGILLFIVSFHIIHDGIERFRSPVRPNIDYFTLIIIFFTLVVNFLVMSYEYRFGKRLNSDLLIADSHHTRSDIFVSLSVLAALVSVRFGWYILDPVVAIVVAMLIIHTAIEILKESSSVLCDSAVVEPKKIEGVVMAIDGIYSVHKIRTRGRCDDIHVDLHVLVRPDMHMDTAHKLSYKIEAEIKNKVSGVSDVVVHMEPREKRIKLLP